MEPRNNRKSLPKLPRHVGPLSKIKRIFADFISNQWWTWEIAAACVSIGATIALIVILKNADQQQQRPWNIGNTQLTLNTVIAIISIIIRASLLVMVAGALNQSPWNWFARKQNGYKQQPSRSLLKPWTWFKSNFEQEEPGRPLKDLDTFGEAANSSWASLKLLYRTRFRYVTLSLKTLSLTVRRYLASLGALITILSLAFDAFAQQVLTADTRMVWASGSNSSAGSTVSRTTSYTGVQEPGFNAGIFTLGKFRTWV